MAQKPFSGKCILEALSEFKEPVTLNEIVEHVAMTLKKPPELVRKLVEEALDGGVRYGFVQKHNEYYYRLSDAVDALVSSEEEDEVESGESLDSIDSGEIPEPPSNNKRKASKSVLTRTVQKAPQKMKKLEAKQSAKYKERAKRERPFGSHSVPEDDKHAKRHHNEEPKHDKQILQQYDAELGIDSGEDENSSRCDECFDSEYVRPYYGRRSCVERQRSRSAHRRY